MEICLQSCAREGGLFADKERVVPDLYKVEKGKIKEAVLDLVIRAPANTRTRYIDVTIRCPHRKGEDHSSNAGAVAVRGEDQKEKRYGAQVMPIAIESYGRMSHESRTNLRQLAWDSVTVNTRDLERSAADVYAAWRLRLERTVMSELADVALSCLGQVAPKPGRRGG